MAAEEQLDGCQKFTLSLKSRSRKKRAIEAEKILSAIYPFKLSSENILVEGTRRKGFYDVYISGGDIRKKRSAAGTFVILAAVLVAVVLAVLTVYHGVLKRKASNIAQKEQARLELEKKRIQKEKEEKLEQLRKEYGEKQLSRYEKIYPYIERIYSVVTEGSTIENLSIDKDIFSVEVTTKDAVKILGNFERNGSFNSVKMNRTTVNSGKETVAYSGMFSRSWKNADDYLSVDEKLEFYSRELDLTRARDEEMRGAQLSEYIKGIRDVLHKNGCSEQYIQLRGGGNSAEIEFFILSTSRSILNFIREIQSEDESLIDIKQIRIRNSEERNRIQTTVCFDSGIELKSGNSQPLVFEEIEISPSDIDKIFYKTASAKLPAKSASSSKNFSSGQAKKAVKSQASAPLKQLSYVGLAKSGGRTFVMAKDDEMGSIYKLPFSEPESAGDFCIMESGGYKAKIRGKYYEVKK